MNATQRVFRQHFTSIMLAMVAMGFLFTLGELIISNHTSGSQLIGLYSTVLGFLLSVHCILEMRDRKKVMIAFLVLTLFGVGGVYKHYEANLSRKALAELQQQISGKSNTATVENSDIAGPPPFAPLSLSGLSAFAILILLGAGETVAADQPSRRTRAADAFTSV